MSTQENGGVEPTDAAPPSVALLKDPAPPFFHRLHLQYLAHLVQTLDTSYEGALMERTLDKCCPWYVSFG